MCFRKVKTHSLFPALLLLLFIPNTTEAQCEPRMDGIYFKTNQFCSYDLQPYNVNSIQLKDSVYQLTVDTVWNENREYWKSLNENYMIRSLYYGYDTMARYLVERETAKEFLMDSGRYYYENLYLATDKFLFNYAVRPGKIFVFGENSTMGVTVPGYSVIGNDRDFIYLIAYEKFRMGKEKYHRGTIIKLDTSGYQIFKVQPERKFYFNHVPLFVNNDYVVKDSFLFSEEVNCNTRYHYQLTTLYKDEVVATNEFAGGISFDPEIDFNRDTLRISYMDTSWMYCKGALVNKISLYDSIILPEPWRKYRFVLAPYENYFIVSLNLPMAETKGFYRDHPALNLNKVPIVEGQPYNTIFLLFNAKTFAYLGIPQIILADL